MPASPNPIERSFEIAAERCEDLTPLVYRRLFDAHPEARTMFRTEGSEPVKGSMLALTIDAILDFAGERTGHFRLIECEVSSHDAYGTPRELFVAFFGIIAETLREILGADWTPDIDAAWRRLLGEINGLVAAQNQLRTRLATGCAEAIPRQPTPSRFIRLRDKRPPRPVARPPRL